MEIDYVILSQVLFGLVCILAISFAMWKSYDYINSTPMYNADELLVENTGNIFQRGKYVYYSKNSDALFVSPTAPTSKSTHPLAQLSTIYVGEL